MIGLFATKYHNAKWTGQNWVCAVSSFEVPNIRLLIESVFLVYQAVRAALNEQVGWWRCDYFTLVNMCWGNGLWKVVGYKATSGKRDCQLAPRCEKVWISTLLGNQRRLFMYPKTPSPCWKMCKRYVTFGSSLYMTLKLESTPWAVIIDCLLLLFLGFELPSTG